MPERKKKRIEAAKREAALEAIKKPARRPGTGLILISVLVAFVLILGGFLFYNFYLAPFQRSVITIDGNTTRMGYFLKRVHMVNTDPANMLRQLVYERIVEETAPNFGVEVTPTDIDNALLYSAANSNSSNTSDNTTPTISETEFKKWYQGELKKSGLSDTQYKEVIATGLTAGRMQEILAAEVPSTADQVHLYVILVANLADASAAKQRISNGENFTDVAGEISLDTATKDSGGDVGWVPRGIVGYDDVVFALPVGQVSDPVAVDAANPNSSQYILFLASEKASNREIDANAMQALKNNALANWLSQEIPAHNIVVNYDFNKQENITWINWQLSKMSKTK